VGVYIGGQGEAQLREWASMPTLPWPSATRGNPRASQGNPRRLPLLGSTLGLYGAMEASYMGPIRAHLAIPPPWLVLASPHGPKKAHAANPIRVGRLATSWILRTSFDTLH
jgi:hypothetical protein